MMVCAALGHMKDDRIVIGFAMEDRNHHAHAESKLRRKRCDAIVLNGIENVGGDAAGVEILRAIGGWSAPLVGTKADIAERVLDLTESLVQEG